VLTGLLLIQASFSLPVRTRFCCAYQYEPRQSSLINKIETVFNLHSKRRRTTQKTGTWSFPVNIDSYLSTMWL